MRKLKLGLFREFTSLFFFFIVSLHSQAASYPVPPAVITALTGSWRNELNSTLTIDSIDDQTGAITGHYSSPSGTSGQDFPLVGWVNTKATDPNHPDNVVVISFSVRWGAVGSITAWNGVFREGGNLITGQWILARPNSDFAWDHLLTGQDRFQRINTKKRE